MLENRKTFTWFAILTLLFGGLIFLISLTSAMSATKMDRHTKNRTLYFDRKILPDHLFYPVLVAVDRLELELSDPEEKIVLKMDYAGKRMEAVKALFYQEKNELAFATLGKAHQYLLKANDDIFIMEDKSKYLSFIVSLNRKFQEEYVNLKIFMDDSQQAKTQNMINELAAVGGKL